MPENDRPTAWQDASASITKNCFLKKQNKHKFKYARIQKHNTQVPSPQKGTRRKIPMNWNKELKNWDNVKKSR